MLFENEDLLMSDSSQGPGWWLASDGKWYPPEAKPGVPLPPPPLNVGSTSPIPLSSTLTGWTVGLMWVAAALNLAVSLAAWNYQSALSGPLYEAVDAEDLYNSATGLSFFVWMATFVLLIVWSAKAHTSSTSLLNTQRARKYSRGWCIGVWFIPFANIFSTPRVFAEHQRIASAPRVSGRAHHEWSKQPLDQRLTWWWVLFWVGAIATQVGASSLTLEASLSEYQNGLTAVICGTLINAIGIAIGAVFLKSVGAALHDVKVDDTFASPPGPDATSRESTIITAAERPQVLTNPPQPTSQRSRPMLPTQIPPPETPDTER